MTEFAYTVIKRPTKDEAGRTEIGWAAGAGREAVPFGGFVTTNRTPKGESRKYAAYTCMPSPDHMQPVFVGDTFKTRAQAAFAIWRKYYEDARMQRAQEKAQTEAEKQQRREERARRREYRQTPEGQKAYREELNRKARERRATMTDEQKAEVAAKLRAKREHTSTVASYSDSE
jgi:hypothetical protein